MQNYEEIADYAVSLGLKKGFDFVEAYIELSEGASYSIEQGKPSGLAIFKSSGIRIRLISKGSLLTFSTNKLDKKAIEDAFRFKPFNGNKVYLSKEKVEKADYKVSEKIKIEDSYTNLPKDLEELDNFVKKEGVSFRSLYVSTGRSKTYLINSEGTRIRSSLPGVSGFFSIIVGKGKESRQRTIEFGKTGGYELLKIDELEHKLEKEIKALHNVLEKGKSLSNYELSKIKNVVASPEIVGIAVHESIGHPSEADRVFGREAAQAGLSYLNSSNLGTKIGSEKVNIIDDPTIKNSYGFFLYDDEGVKARPKILVKEGIQNELLLNREYAYLTGKRSNASARSDSYSNEPIIRMSNTYLEKGDANIEELFSEAKNGIYIKSFTEWNIDDTRSFARYQGNEAYLIKNGEPSVPIKNYKLDASTFDFWKAVSLLGNDFELYPGNCGKGEPMQGVPVMMGGPSVLLKFG